MAKPRAMDKVEEKLELFDKENQEKRKIIFKKKTYYSGSLISIENEFKSRKCRILKPTSVLSLIT